MAKEKGAGTSKTNVSARAKEKAAVRNCSRCKNPVDVVMTLTLTGKKYMARRCCGAVIG